MTNVQQIKLKKCKYEFDYIIPLFEKKPKHCAFIAIVDGVEVGKNCVDINADDLIEDCLFTAKNSILEIK